MLRQREAGRTNEADKDGQLLTTTSARLCALLGALLLSSGGLVAQTRAPERAWNPHGPLAIACENCHTTTSWTPLRKALEFNHNTETKYPLRGLHQNVACNSCHVRKIFTNVGKLCADCHADIHRRQFGAACQDCHTVNGWRANVDAIRGHLNRFPLLGTHAALQCDDCHRGAASGQFIGLSTACISCHQQDFQQASPLNHVAANFPTTCETCHSMDHWQGATFNHATTGFALTGGHATVACTQCHINNNYSLTSGACANCHMNDYNGTTSPNHKAGGISTTCDSCHNTTSWAGASFNHATTGFALTGAHATVLCAQCHINNNYTLTSGACANCHMADYNGTTSPNHKAGGISTTCDSCHNTTSWAGASFDHATTGFALTGAHATVPCAQCHINGNYGLTSGACANCHMTDYNGATNPNHRTGGFPTTCDSCHNTTSWAGASFDHATTGFALTGAHTTVQCAQCHINNNYSLTSGACANCHMNDYNGTTTPTHKAGGISTTCDLCHNTTSWAGASFNHATTGFALTGAHTTTPCAQCHINNNYSLTSAACINCHLTDYNGTTDPPHKSAGFPQDCSMCHTTVNWLGATFNHTTTGFTLTGAHATTPCAQCHTNNNYSLTSAACINCHLTDYNGTTDPPHKSAGFPQDCSMCHTTVNWLGATFNHTTTGFTLTGAHTTVQCAQCHVNNNYSLTSGACANCHMADYNGTNNPNHKASGFPTTCDSCHNTTSWDGATFNHSTTGFPLTGAHTTVPCAQCHVNNNYSLTSGACANCHMTDYNGTTNPNHKASGFPTTCDSCHNTTSWAGATFNHSTTGFPLTGAHTSLQCTQCHVNNNYSLTSGACANCHMADYNSTNNPAHAPAGFPTDCSICHTTVNWSGATFNHSTTGFALTGAHTSLQCTQCHINNNYSLTSGACANCHMADYNGTNNPPHAAAGFPTTCDTCHNTTSWSGATFNHATTGWALTGAHTTTPCTSCHINGNYSLTSTACYGCHQTDYQNTTDPNHVAAGFPTTCDTCHTTTSWSGATFNHTWFPIPHHSATTCTSCHTNSSDYTVFVCTTCHTQAQTDPEHKGVKGYVWSSPACYSCHPNGKGGG